MKKILSSLLLFVLLLNSFTCFAQEYSDDDGMYEQVFNDEDWNIVCDFMYNCTNLPQKDPNWNEQIYWNKSFVNEAYIIDYFGIPQEDGTCIPIDDIYSLMLTLTLNEKHEILALRLCTYYTDDTKTEMFYFTDASEGSISPSFQEYGKIINDPIPTKTYTAANGHSGITCSTSRIGIDENLISAFLAKFQYPNF